MDDERGLNLDSALRPRNIVFNEKPNEGKWKGKKKLRQRCRLPTGCWQKWYRGLASVIAAGVAQIEVCVHDVALRLACFDGRPENRIVIASCRSQAAFALAAEKNCGKAKMHQNPIHRTVDSALVPDFAIRRSLTQSYSYKRQKAFFATGHGNIFRCRKRLARSESLDQVLASLLPCKKFANASGYVVMDSFLFGDGRALLSLFALGRGRRVCARWSAAGSTGEMVSGIGRSGAVTLLDPVSWSSKS